MTNWNIAQVFDAIAESLPDAPALKSDLTTVSWAEFRTKAYGLANFFLENGLKPNDKIAQYLYNCNEYLESIYAAFAAGMVPVNTNYRYTDAELIYLFDNSDASAIIFHGSFSPNLERIKDKLGQVKLYIWVDDGSGDRPDFAVDYYNIVSGQADQPNVTLSGDDLFFLYTGGTTGMPKGVMWRQDDLFAVLNASNLFRWPENASPDYIKQNLKHPGICTMPACPLMHGTGIFTSLSALFTGGSVATTLSKSFNPIDTLRAIDKFRVNTLAIVGDAFAKPLADALEGPNNNFDLTSLRAIISSGVMFSEHTKETLLKHLPNLIIIDVISSSEALGVGASLSSSNKIEKTAEFSLGERAVVLDDNFEILNPGSDKIGRLALRGRNPVGYYKDEEKTKRTFPVIDGVRYSVPGDYAVITPEGKIHVLGRGSQCINTGGEKVFPEEVEETLKLHNEVADAAVVGVSDARFGEIVTAVVQMRRNSSVTAEQLIAFVKGRLAGYKAPKHIIFDKVNRSASGKLDYNALKSVVAKRIATSN